MAEGIKVFGKLELAFRAFFQLTELFGLRDAITEYVLPPRIEDRTSVTIISWYGDDEFLTVEFVFVLDKVTRFRLGEVRLHGQNFYSGWGPKISSGDDWRRTLRVVYPFDEKTIFFIPPEGREEFFTGEISEPERRGLLLRYFYRDDPAA